MVTRAEKGLEPMAAKQTLDEQLAREVQDLRRRLAQAEADKARGEAALQKSEARFHAFLDNSPCVAFLKDREGRKIYGNAGLDRFLSTKDRSFLGTTDFETYPAEIAQKLREHDDMVLATGEPLETIEEVPGVDGILRTWLVMKFPVPDEAGNRLLGGVAVDITARQRAELGLRESEQRVRLALDAGKMATWGWDIVGNRLDEFGPQCRALIGFSADEPVTFEACAARLHPEDAPRLAARLRHILATPGDDEWREEFRILHPEFGERWLFGLGRCFRDEMGRALRMMGVVYDRTERRQAAKDLEQRNVVLQSILDSMAEGVVVADENGQVILYNRAAEQIAGVGRVQSGPSEWAEQYGIFLSDGVTRMAEEQVPLMRAIRGESTDAVDLYINNKELSEGRWLNVSSRPLRTEDGKHLGGVVVFRDVSERRRDEVKLKEYAVQLQALSRRLLEVQEEERRYLARELHDEVGQALTGLKLALERGALEQTGHPRDAHGAAIKLIQELMVRVRALSMHLRPTLLDDLGLLPALLWHTRQYTEQTGVNVSVDPVGLETTDRLPPEVETAAYRIVQEALTNVARHAQVNVATLQIRRDADMLFLNVVDTGAGFQPGDFWKSSGISGMRERATLLDGTLTVQSRPGAGTQIIARLPIRGQPGGHSDS
jgi:PAS domain S-box-containing protein